MDFGFNSICQAWGMSKSIFKTWACIFSGLVWLFLSFTIAVLQYFDCYIYFLKYEDTLFQTGCNGISKKLRAEYVDDFKVPCINKLCILPLI